MTLFAGNNLTLGNEYQQFSQARSEGVESEVCPPKGGKGGLGAHVALQNE